MSNYELVLMVGNFIIFITKIYFYILLVYIFSSWVPAIREGVIGEWLGKICEPYLSIFRRIIPPIGFIDISAIPAMFVLQFFMMGVASIVNLILASMV